MREESQSTNWAPEVIVEDVGTVVLVMVGLISRLRMIGMDDGWVAVMVDAIIAPPFESG